MSEIIQLNQSHWQSYKNIRLEALQNSPASFGSNYEVESQLLDDDWKNRLMSKDTLSTGILINGVLVAIASLFFSSGNCKHKADLIGVYTRPNFRGSGLSTKLILQLIRLGVARGLEKVVAGVNVENLTALNVYLKLDFKIKGLLEKNIKYNKKYYNEYILEKILI